MNIYIRKSDLDAILPLRSLYLQAMNTQIRYDSCHARGWSDSYLIFLDDMKIGYASVKGREDLSDRNAVFEFYIIPKYRKKTSVIFQELLKITKVSFIECQSNDLVLSALQNEFSHDINADYILFKDHYVTSLNITNNIFRERGENEKTFSRDPGGYVLVVDGEIVATGGFLLHYNVPFADVYMEVSDDHRQKGYGVYILQEIKSVCYLAGRVPAARCYIKNTASKLTLLKAGFEVSGYMMTGKIK